MRMAGQCFNRCPGVVTFQEEGRGLGFSIGGWHPLRINTYLPTLKKLDPLANTALGKLAWKPIEKVDRFQAQKFQKVKKWSQDHRKQLQIAAAIAAMAVGGAFALGYLGTGAAAGASAGAGAAAAEGAAAAAAGTAAAAEGAAAAGAAAGAAEAGSVIATTTMATETLAPIAVGTSSAGAATASLTSLVPATVTASQATTGASILSTLGKAVATTGEYGKTALTTLALVKAVSGGTPQPQESVMPPITVSQWGGGGYTGGGGGGGFLGPSMTPTDAYGNPVAPAPETLPSWLLPAAGIGLLALLLKD